MTGRRGVWVIGLLLVLLAALVSGCGSLRDAPPTPEPIFVTATDDPLLLPIVATETPSPTPVATLTVAALLPTPDLSTRTPTPTRPAPATLTPTFTPTTTDTPGTPGGPGQYGPVGGGVDTVLAGNRVRNRPAGCAWRDLPERLRRCKKRSAARWQARRFGGRGVPALPERADAVGVVAGDDPQPSIYALLNDGTYQRLNDTFVEGVDPESVGSQPPEGLLEPQRGFGKAWRENPPVRDRIGWATGPENPSGAQVLPFERGEMVRVDGLGQTFIFISGAPGTWTAR